MTENQNYLEQARAHIQEFQAELETERLREASMALENVVLMKEHDPRTRARLRSDCLFLWLHLLQLVDGNLDPGFNPEDVPINLVQPPPTSGGVVYPPGADPALIDDPQKRAEYEKAIAASREKANKYRLQVQLHRVNDYIPPRVKAFIRDSYNSTPGDQRELKTAIEKNIKDVGRKAWLLTLLDTPH
ncbi:hypothetical protein ACN28S_58150 [Cystobacter fuscus]